MNDSYRFTELRSQYRARWDEYQRLAHTNAELRHEGRQPPDEQLAKERQAAASLERARHALISALANPGLGPLLAFGGDEPLRDVEKRRDHCTAA